MTNPEFKQNHEWIRDGAAKLQEALQALQNPLYRIIDRGPHPHAHMAYHADAALSAAFGAIRNLEFAMHEIVKALEATEQPDPHESHLGADHSVHYGAGA